MGGALRQHLTSLLRRVYERRDEALARARRARAVVAVYDTAVVCAALAELLGAPDP